MQRRHHQQKKGSVDPLLQSVQAAQKGNVSSSGNTDGKPPEYVPLPVLGQIREKGFGPDKQASSFRGTHVSAPQPTVLPFPIARHRSEGPHWAPPQAPEEETREPETDPDYTIGEGSATYAQPLIRKKKKTLSFMKHRTESTDIDPVEKGMGATSSSDCTNWRVKRTGDAQPQEQNPHKVKDEIGSQKVKDDKVSIKVDQAQVGAILTDEMSLKAAKSLVMSNESAMKNIDDAHAQDQPYEEYNRCAGTLNDTEGKHVSHQNANELLSTQILKNETQDTMQDFEEFSDATLENMSHKQIVEAQQELSKRFRPDIIEMLRHRGKKKFEEHKNKAKSPEVQVENGKGGTQEGIFSGQPTNAIANANIAKGSSAVDAFSSGMADHVQSQNKSWTDRVEAVRLFRFGLDGDFISNGQPTLPGDTNIKNIIPSVTERDLLRTEGDPSSHGYTIKEAVDLSRSMVPAQRSAGLRLLSNILEKATFSLQSIGNRECSAASTVSTIDNVDWQAIWAYALGPEPELVLTLRMALDDSHATAVVTCARTLECLLSYSANESYFTSCEFLWPGDRCLFTAPVFQKPRSQEIGVIGDSHWKYNVKPSDMFPFSSTEDSEKDEGEALVKDDTTIAKQDVAAGLIRMGILPRIRYILEVDRLVAAEDFLFSILISLARHSPASADAVIKCPRLMDTILELFNQDKTMKWPVRSKAIKLLKVLSIARKSHCIQIFNTGLFQAAQLGLSYQGLTVGSPIQKQNECQISVIGLVESLSFWTVCIKYSIGITCFSDLYPALVYWISNHSLRWRKEGSPAVENATLIVSSFKLLEALARTLPVLHAMSESEIKQDSDVDALEKALGSVEMDTWSWKYAIPMVENSLGWLSNELIQILIQNLQQLGTSQRSGDLSFIMPFRIISSVLHFLSTVCERILEDGRSAPSWLPTFVPKVVMRLVGSGLLRFKSDENPETEVVSLVSCFLRAKEKLSSEGYLEVTNCLYGLIRLVKILDCLFSSVQLEAQKSSPNSGDEPLGGGLAATSEEELTVLLRTVGGRLIQQSYLVGNSYTATRRGGPAPGVGVGWGSAGGGYWSCHALTAQLDSVLALEVIELYPSQLRLQIEDTDSNSWMMKLGLSISCLAAPDCVNVLERVCQRILFDKASFDSLLVKVGLLLKKWFPAHKTEDSLQTIDSYVNPIGFNVEEIGSILYQHFHQVWFRRKVKPVKVTDRMNAVKVKNSRKANVLPTVVEGKTSAPESYEKDSLAVEWAGQKLPLPSFWLYSPLLNRNDSFRSAARTDGFDEMDVTRYGFLLLFGLEALSNSLSGPKFRIPVSIKIHALSNVFLLSDDLFLDGFIRCMISALQELYVDQSQNTGEDHEDFIFCSLNFEKLVDDRYTSFIEKLTSQFASVSFGDIVFGRQVVIYLRRDVPDSLRLRLWKCLESEHMLEFLPRIEQCCGHIKDYLLPIEENQEILKAYASSWISGALDKARARSSASFYVAQFHIASYIFKRDCDHDLLSRKAFAKNLLIGLARRPQFQESLLQIMNFNSDGNSVLGSLGSDEVKFRCMFLEKVCEDSPSLLAQVRSLSVN